MKASERDSGLVGRQGIPGTTAISRDREAAKKLAIEWLGTHLGGFPVGDRESLHIAGRKAREALESAIAEALAEARVAGVRAGIEAAAKSCDGVYNDHSEEPRQFDRDAACGASWCAASIRSLDAAKIAQEAEA